MNKKVFRFLFALPFIIILVFFAFAFEKQGFMAVWFKQVPFEVEQIDGLLEMVASYLPWLILASILPIVFYVIYFASGFKKKSMDLEVLKKSKARLLSVSVTGVRFNKTPVYEVRVGILESLYEEEIIAECVKSVCIPSHVIHHLRLNESYLVAYDTGKVNDFYIDYTGTENWI